MMTLQDIPPAQASLAMSVLALSNGIGRLLCGLATQYADYVLIIQGIFSTVAAVCLFLLPHCTSPLHFYVAVGIYGLTLAPIVVLNTTALVKIVGMDGLSTAYGINETIFGIGSMVGPTLIGMAHDYFGDYQIPFYLAGTCFGFGVIINFITSNLLFA